VSAVFLFTKYFLAITECMNGVGTYPLHL